MPFITTSLASFIVRDNFQLLVIFMSSCLITLSLRVAVNYFAHISVCVYTDILVSTIIIVMSSIVVFLAYVIPGSGLSRVLTS